MFYYMGFEVLIHAKFARNFNFIKIIGQTPSEKESV